MNQKFEDRLITEAAEQSPVFSQDLHERIMGRVAHAPAGRARSSARGWIIYPIAIAACAMIVAGLSIHMNRSKPKRMAMHVVPSVPIVSDPVDALNQPIADAWSNTGYAGLDRDGQQLLGYMARQLDVMPEQR